jgi:hypothetical protein
MGIANYFTRRSLAILALAAALPISAQEGFPLKGSWIGVWEGNTQHGNDVLIVMNWDGKNISGVINPGTDNINISKASLDPVETPSKENAKQFNITWKVHLEADAKGKTGQALHYVIDGNIQQVELPSRSVVGTWSSQAGKGKFEIRRQ